MENNNAATEVKQIMKKPKKKNTARNVLILFIVIVLLAFPFMVHFYSNSKVKTKLKELTAKPVGDCFVLYGSAKYNIWSKHLIIKNLTVSCANKNIAEFGVVDLVGLTNASPFSDLNVSFTNGVIHNNSQIYGKYGNALKEMGYSELYANGKFTLKYDNAVGTFNLSQLNISFSDFGTVVADFEVLDVKDSSPVALLNKIIKTPYNNLWVKFGNSGVVSKVLFGYGKSNFIDIIKAKQRALDGLDRTIKRMKAKDPNTGENLVQLYRFIQKGNEITISSSREFPDTSIKTLFDIMSSESYKGLARDFSTLPLTLTSN